MKLIPFVCASLLAGCTLYFGESKEGPPIPGAPPGEEPGCGGGGLPPACGPVEVHVIGVYEPGPTANNTPGEAFVTIERPGAHALVLSAYEPTTWHVTLGEGATLTGIHLVGYHAQHVDCGIDVPVTHDTYEQGGQPACGYSLPYNGEGCDTNELLAIGTARAGGAVTTFHGCYSAQTWTLHADGHATSDCRTDAGYEVNEMFGECVGSGSGDWTALEFATEGAPTCTGDRFVRFDAAYGLHVGAILCGSSDSYKLYLSDSLDKPFLEIADYAGHGQDHCELVNPAFTIPDEDDITSGGCTTCSVDNLIDLIGVPVYARSVFGEPFERVISRDWADLTTPRYACGVSIP